MEHRGTISGHPLVVKDPGHADIVIGLPPVIAIAAVSALVGWLFLALLERCTRHARRLWTGVALTVLLISFLPVAGAETTPLTRLSLTLMHLTVAAALFTGAYTPALSHFSR